MVFADGKGNIKNLIENRTWLDIRYYARNVLFVIAFLHACVSCHALFLVRSRCLPAFYSLPVSRIWLPAWWRWCGPRKEPLACGGPGCQCVWEGLSELSVVVPSFPRVTRSLRANHALQTKDDTFFLGSLEIRYSRDGSFQLNIFWIFCFHVSMSAITAIKSTICTGQSWMYSFLWRVSVI